MKTKLNILQLQDPATEAESIRNILTNDKLHFEIILADTKDKFIQALLKSEFDVILHNDHVPFLTAVEALGILNEKNIKAPFILISSPQTDLFVAALFKKGAADYISKKELFRITAAITGAIEDFKVHKELENCNDELKAEATRYHALTASSAEAVIILSAEGKPSYASANVKNILGYTPKEVIETDLLKLAHPDDLLPLGKVLEKALANPGIPMKGHTGRILHKDKTWRWIEATVTNMLHNPAVNGIVDNFRDVTDQKNADEKIVHLNRMYAFISQVNQAISHSKNQKQTLKNVCKIAVNTGKFKAAWIGFFDYKKKKINLVESVGIKTEDLSKFKNILYDNNGPQEMVLRTKRYYVCNNIQHDFPLQDWKDLMAKRGYGSIIVLPIFKSGAVIATFNLYATEINFFTEAEISLLVEATGDISFALDLFEKQQQKLAADELIKNKELHLSQAQAIAHLGSWELDFSTGIAEWSDELLRIYGLPATENIQTWETWMLYIHPDDREKVHLIVDASNAAKRNADFYHRIVRKDGAIRCIHTLTHIELDADNNPVGLHGVGYDVTEMKEAEEALQQSEADLRAIFENTSDGFILCDINGIIKSFNSKARDRIRLNIEQEVEVGKSIFGFLPHSRKKKYADNILKVGSGEILRYDYPYTRKNGETKWFSFTINPVYNAGQVEGISITSTNITERKKAEEQLKESELFNKGILASLSSHIAVVDHTGYILAVNKAWDDFAKANGVHSLQSVSAGSNYIEVCQRSMDSGDNFAAQTLQGIQSVFNKEVKIFELEYPCHSLTEQRWFNLSVMNFGEDGSKVVISHQNITERKKTEEKLLRSEYKYRQIVETAQEGIWMFDEENRTTFVNQKMCDIIGYSSAEMIGKTNLFFKDAAGMQMAKNNIERRRHGITETYDSSFLTKEGKLIWTQVASNPMFTDEGIYGGSLCMLADITEKKNLEKAVEYERDQFFDMFSEAPSAIGKLKGPNHIFEMANPLYLQLTGKKDLIGKSVAEALPEVIEQGFIAKLDKVYLTGETYIGTDKLVRIDTAGHGELTDFYINFVYQAYRNAKGEIEGIFFFINNVTEQILSRKEIEKSEKFFKGVIENSDDMITMLDSTGKTIYASPAVSKKFGYTNAECLNLTLNDVIHPDDGLMMQEFVVKIMMRPGVPMQCPLLRERKKDGSYIWVEGTLTNFLETEGINAIVGNFRDVTEKKRLESLLNKSNRLARIGSWEFDVANSTVFWSDITKEIREVAPDFVPRLDDGISYFKDGKNKEIIMHRVEDCIGKGLAWDEELEITTHKGNSKWVRTIGEGEFVNGKCVKVYGSFQDINARKEAEREALKAYEEKNIILESIGDAFFAVDKHWIVTYWNNQAEKMLKLSKTEMVGNSLWDKFSHNTDAYKKYHKAVANKQVIHFEDYYKPLDKWYGISAYPSDNGLSVYFKDITEKKIAEQKLKDLNNELEESVKQLVLSNAELEQFAYVASHDLQEPLRMVTSFLLQIEKKYAGALDAKGKKYIHFAMDGARRMKQIILDLLEFSLVGQVDDKLETVDLNELLHEALGLLRKKIEEKKAVIKIGRLPVIKTLKPPLLQVFQNLLSNSLKYHSKGDAVKIVVSVKENKNNWEFAVSDNGIGIAPEYFDKIFTIFQRLHNRDEYSGTGIGLAISKKIIENMGGKIWVESNEGKGSTFYFTLLK